MPLRSWAMLEKLTLLALFVLLPVASIVTLTILASQALAQRRRARDPARLKCPECGYSRVGLATSTCPECGCDTAQRWGRPGPGLRFLERVLLIVSAISILGIIWIVLLPLFGD